MIFEVGLGVPPSFTVAQVDRASGAVEPDGLFLYGTVGLDGDRNGFDEIAEGYVRNDERGLGRRCRQASSGKMLPEHGCDYRRGAREMRSGRKKSKTQKK